MATLIHDCPYCGAKNSSFQVAYAGADPIRAHNWNLLLTCPNCWRGIVAQVSNGGTGRNPKEHAGELRFADAVGYKYNIIDIAPSAKPADIPEHLPPTVAKAFKEGCNVLLVSPNAACGQFRRALELALKEHTPEIEAWKLEKRIDKMAAAGKLTTSLKDWAHQLRLDGNNAVHEDEVSPEDAKQVESLTRFVLTYLFTLPKSVEIARGADPE